MGMTSATKACDALSSEIEKEGLGRLVALSSNMCTDKKASSLNFLLGRGKGIVCDAVIKHDVVEEVLKTTPEKMIEVNYAKNLLGTARAGSLGFNAHFANIISAFFLATGQDIAQVSEAAIGITTMEKEGEDLYASVTIPDLPLATVGGGTRIETQKEAISILKLEHGVFEMAQVLGAAVLAGELSLVAALASRHLTSAHLILVRKEK